MHAVKKTQTKTKKTCNQTSYLMINVALMIFPGFRRLVDFSLTVNAVVHQDVAPTKCSRKCINYPEKAVNVRRLSNGLTCE